MNISFCKQAQWKSIKEGTISSLNKEQPLEIGMIKCDLTKKTIAK